MDVTGDIFSIRNLIQILKIFIIRSIFLKFYRIENRNVYIFHDLKNRLKISRQIYRRNKVRKLIGWEIIGKDD